MFQTLSQILAVVRASIGANNALQHMIFSQVQDMDALKAAFLADLNTQIDTTDVKSETPVNGNLVGA